MNAWGVVAAVVTVVGAISGTIWTSRRSGPEMTKIVLGSVGDQVKRLDAEVKQLASRVNQLDAALAAERAYTALLVSAMRAGSIAVPPRPAAAAPSPPSEPLID